MMDGIEQKCCVPGVTVSLGLRIKVFENRQPGVSHLIDSKSAFAENDSCRVGVTRGLRLLQSIIGGVSYCLDCGSARRPKCGVEFVLADLQSHRVDSVTKKRGQQQHRRDDQEGSRCIGAQCKHCSDAEPNCTNDTDCLAPDVCAPPLLVHEPQVSRSHSSAVADLSLNAHLDRAVRHDARVRRHLLTCATTILLVSGCTGYESVPTQTLPPSSPEDIEPPVDSRNSEAIVVCANELNAKFGTRIDQRTLTWRPTMDGIIVNGLTYRDDAAAFTCETRADSAGRLFVVAARIDRPSATATTAARTTCDQFD